MGGHTYGFSFKAIDCLRCNQGVFGHGALRFQDQDQVDASPLDINSVRHFCSVLLQRTGGPVGEAGDYGGGNPEVQLRSGARRRLCPNSARAERRPPLSGSGFFVLAREHNRDTILMQITIYRSASRFKSIFHVHGRLQMSFFWPNKFQVQVFTQRPRNGRIKLCNPNRPKKTRTSLRRGDLY
jgi:hypothetical protein